MRVCIEGNIGSGKSDVMQALKDAFPNVPTYPEPVEEWKTLLDLYYEQPRSWSFAFSLQVLLSFLDPAKQETCIVERSPLASRHVFGQMLYNMNYMNVQEWELFKGYHDKLSWMPDVIFYIDTPAHTCLERIAKRARECEKGIDVEYLRKVEHQYDIMLRFANVPVVRFQGTLPPEELHAAVIAQTCQVLGIH